MKADGTVEVADVETNGNVEVSEDGTKVIVTDDVYPGSVDGDDKSPQLRTTVKAGAAAAEPNAPASITANDAMQGVQVVDTIAYKNLVAGANYIVTGKLFKVVEGEVAPDAAPLAVKTEELQASDTGAGSWVIDFGAVSGLEPGASYVVFERAVSVENLVDGDGDGQADKPQEGSHEDPTDPSQTVTVKPVEPETPNTPGGNTPGEPVEPKGGLASTGAQAGAVLALAVAVLAGGVFLASRRRRG